MVKKIGVIIKRLLAKAEGYSQSNDVYFDCAQILEEGYSIIDNERYFHILNKIANQYYRDTNFARMMEDIDSWIEETPSEDARNGLKELKKRLLANCIGSE